MSIIPGSDWSTLLSLDYSISFNACALSSTGQYSIACTSSSVYYSSNYGYTWTASTTTINNSILSASISDTGNAIVSTSFTGSTSYIWCSTNYGQTWTQSSNTFTGNLISTSISANGTYGIVAVPGSSLYYSSNGGSSWSVSNSITANWSSVSISANGTYALATVINGGIYYSINNGQTWAVSYSTANPWNSVSLSASGGYALALSYTNGIYYINTSSGTSWTTGWSQIKPIQLQYITGYINQNNQSIAGLAIAETNYIFCATTNNAAYLSSDGGYSFIGEIGNSAACYQVACDKTGQYVFYTNTQSGTIGLKYSTNYGITLSNITDSNGNLTSGAYPTQVACSADAKYVYVFTTSKLCYAKDGNYLTWYKSTISIPANVSAYYGSMTCSDNGKYVYCNMYITSPLSTQIYFSSDYGQTYNVLTNGNQGSSLIAGIKCNSVGDVVYASVGSFVTLTNSGVIYISTNYGQNWSTINSVTYNWLSISCNSLGNFVLAAAYNGPLYYSYDYGQTWINNTTTWTSNNSSQKWYSVAVTRNSNKFVAGYGSSGGIYVFTYSIPTYSINCVSISDSGNAITCDDTYSYYSTDYGNTWNKVKKPSPFFSVQLSKNGNYAISIYQNTINSSPTISALSSTLNLSITSPQMYYSFNHSDRNITNRLINWASGSPVYDASMNSSLNGSYISRLNYQVDMGSIEFPKNVIAIPGSGSGTTVGQLTGLSISQNELRAIACSNITTPGIYYSYRINVSSSFGFNNIPNSPTRAYFKCGLTADGRRGVTCVSGGRVYLINWTDVAPSLVGTTLDDISRNYTGLAITLDGSRMVASTDTNVFFATWTGTNYTAFTQTLNTLTTPFYGISISANGDRIVYSTSSITATWYLSYWNGTNYNDGVCFRSSSYTARSSCFNNDSSILFLSYNNPSTYAVESCVFDICSNSYDTFSNILTNMTSVDCFIICYIDHSNTGTMYSFAGTTLHQYTANYTVATSSTQTNYITLPSFATDNNGYSVATWFRSNYNYNPVRIFDFGNGASPNNNIMLYFSPYGNGTLYYSVTTNSIDISGGPLPQYFINDGTWHHVAITSTYVSSGFSNVIIYLDGQAIYNTSNTFPYPSNITRNLNYIGRSNTSTDYAFYGNIDDFRWYNTVLTPAQVSLIYSMNPIINNNINYQACTIYRSSITTNVTSNWGSTSSMGIGTTYYYWIDPNAVSGTYTTFVNYPNPIKFSYTYNNTGNLTQAKLYLMVDDICSGIYVNGTQITGVSIGWNITITPTTISLIPGNNLFEFYCISSGGGAMIAVYVTSTADAFLFNTGTSTTGWTAIKTGFFYKNMPITSFIPNEFGLINYRIAIPTTTYRAGGYDISLNNTFNMISPYNTLGYFTNGVDLATLEFRPYFIQPSSGWSIGSNIVSNIAVTYITFTSGTGTITFYKSCTIQILVVGGGGGGGYQYGGGGGSGGVIYKSSYSITAGTSYTWTVGTAGSGATSSSSIGSNGVSSVFNDQTAVGGGGGGSANLSTAAGSGGSGGGAATSGGAAGSGTAGQGYSGGSTATIYPGAGGGGPGGAGSNGTGTTIAGNGGAGLSLSITGVSLTYGGGGGGGYGGSSNSTGGSGGGVGGNGAYYYNAYINATNATGYGGGGGGSGGASNTTPGNGSAGVIIIRLT